MLEYLLLHEAEITQPLQLRRTITLGIPDDLLRFTLTHNGRLHSTWVNDVLNVNSPQTCPSPGLGLAVRRIEDDCFYLLGKDGLEYCIQSWGEENYRAVGLWPQDLSVYVDD